MTAADLAVTSKIRSVIQVQQIAYSILALRGVHTYFFAFNCVHFPFCPLQAHVAGDAMDVPVEPEDVRFLFFVAFLCLFLKYFSTVCPLLQKTFPLNTLKF
jgi:hypothetical protein